jgi:hypothetical protein
MLYAKAYTPLPPALSSYIKSIDYGKIGNSTPDVVYSEISKDRVYVQVIWNLKDTVRQDDLQINIQPNFIPQFHYAPHLTPDNEHIIAQHVFRSPAMIVASAQKQLTIIPDIEMLKTKPLVDWYMDMDAQNNRLTLGMSLSAVKEHVLFVRKSGAVFPKGRIEFGFYIFISNSKQDLFDPWRKPAAFFWEKWGHALYNAGEPLLHKDLEPYIQQTYKWAFGTWKKSVWQEITIDGKKMGAPVFIVNVTQSPNYKGIANEREFRSVWNQAWFSSLRSASGLYRYARRVKDSSLMRYALMTKELALSFPQRDGFFNSVIATEMGTYQVNGETYNRSKGWEHYYFGNSNRNPYTWDARLSPYHILDMSVTASYMLDWYNDLEKDKRLLNYSISYADALIKIQRKDGFFPAWLSLQTLQPLDYLNTSPETSMSVTFLLKLYRLTKIERYKNAALKAMQAVMDNVIPASRWEDFETYWSCSRYGADELVGKKILRNDMYKKNNFSTYWTAQALLYCYKETKEKKYLNYGIRTLDELLMAQAVWQPAYMAIHTLGGFGVMNADGEWNDARQSLFAGLILSYGVQLNKREYLERGLSALRASFTMMYSPENAATKKQWEYKWSFFGKEDYGFMMENYGHGGETNNEGLGIGEFTIYDWGNGAAAEAYNRLRDKYGEKFLLGNF